MHIRNFINRNRYRNLQAAKEPLEGQAYDTSLFNLISTRADYIIRVGLS